jgi:hypothetical protein
MSSRLKRAACDMGDIIMTKRLIALAMAAIAITAGSRVYAQTSSVVADVPRVISYQGVLTTDNGTPIPDGPYRITVSLYADESGGNRVWQESYSTTVAGGVFAIRRRSTGRCGSASRSTAPGRCVR